MKIRKLYGKIILRGKLKAITGLKIGAGRNVAEIGGVDSPVIRDPVTQYPYIPGSSLKGRLRSLFEIYIATLKDDPNFFNKDIGTKDNPVRIHVCEDYEKAVVCPVCRLFGASGDKSNFPSRLIIRDLHLTEEWRKKPLEELTEVKPEISIDRITSKTNLRHFERVVAGAEFEFEIIYNVERLDQWQEDIKNLFTAMSLLEDSYLGGSGSRGYGKVQFAFESIELRPLKYYQTGDEETVFLVKDVKEKSTKTLLKEFDTLFSDIKRYLEEEVKSPKEAVTGGV
ncbi:type III-A CRISPR-associated RAMP protein Csm3 [Pyrococcus kukulkanii]|uniref:CRISPR system Cms endoribonuclease Csm3 n=1 Tax=Pyrococcus kukulkanii TaxID=1609559 RepID=A0ABV4T3Y3_9EURY